ncbi:MAG TPA: DUF1573 domain-containing protein [candidate division Zixibacteria bacterium]|nr:DUF1573 domain-containing protein [candidate division Zixibacteria bacterium]
MSLVGALLAALAPAAARAYTDQPDSKMTIPADQFEWGFAPQKSSLTRTFWLKPAGDDTVFVFKVIPGCSCTQSPLEKDTIPPGDSARLEIIFDSGRYLGRVHKRPQIQINDELFPHVLMVWANILPDSVQQPPLDVRPRSLELPADAKSGAVTLTNIGDDPISLQFIEIDRRYVNGTLPARLDPGAAVELNLQVSVAPEGWLVKSVTLEARPVDGGEAVRYTIPVRLGEAPATDSAGNH